MKYEKPIDPIDNYVGERLRLARNLRGLSQQKLGELEGITFQQVQKYESGANRISASRLVHMAHFLKMPIKWFFEGLDSHDTSLDGYDIDILKRRETVELIRAYYQIDDARKREAGMNILKSLAV